MASEVKPFFEGLRGAMPKARTCETVLCVPFPLIPAAVRFAKDVRAAIGAQDVSEKCFGAHTGEVAAEMLKDLDVRYAIVGHSERRAAFGETDAQVNGKVHVLTAHAISPIICVGESQAQHDNGLTAELVTYQVKAALAGVDEENIKKCIIAYEPIWAIGTGRIAEPDQVEAVCSEIRGVVRKLYGATRARAISILYGGSMNGNNCAELLARPDIDGGLIGGASLDPREFARIIAATAME